MNLIRTIQQSAKQEWLNLLFDPESGPAPKNFEPLSYPFPMQFRQDVQGGFLYVRYKGKIIGYGKIADVQCHSGDTVGEENIPVSAGDMVILEAPLSPMPASMPYPGLFRWKYIKDNLHEGLKTSGKLQPSFVPRPSSMTAEEIELQLRKLEEKIKGGQPNGILETMP